MKVEKYLYCGTTGEKLKATAITTKRLPCKGYNIFTASF